MTKENTNTMARYNQYRKVQNKTFSLEALKKQIEKLHGQEFRLEVRQMADELQQVAIRMVEQPPLYSNEPMNNPDAAVRVMNDFLAQMDRELFCIVNLQADLTPINMNVVSVGALNEAMVHPREIFKSAILSNAHSMMLVHNHPSGNLTPSEEDIVTTARMQQLGEMMGIHLVDHIITGKDRNY